MRMRSKLCHEQARHWLLHCTLATICIMLLTRAHADESAAADKPYFDVWEYRVAGNTLLAIADVECTLTPHLGASKNIDDIEAARKALEQRYRDSGYPSVLVDIPEQDVNGGIVRLRVTEGRIETLHITGSRYFSLQNIRAAVPALAEGKPLYLPEVQHGLNALNAQTSDRSVTPVLRPGRTPGTVDVELKVKDELPLHGNVELNNRQSSGTSRLRLGAGLRYDNLWQREHSFGVQWQTAPENTSEVRVLSGTYLARFTSTDTLLAVYGVHSSSSSATVGDLAVIGRGDIGGLRVIVPFAADGLFNHSVTLGIDYKDFKEDLHVQGQDNPLSTPIDYVQFSTQYAANRHEEAASYKFNIGANFGVRGIGDHTIECPRLALDDQGNKVVAQQPYNEFGCKRAGAVSNYMILRGNAEYTRTLPRGFALRAVLDGQLADSPLISNEEYAAGGAESVRGYYESQVLGDNGVRATLEFTTPSFGALLSDRLVDMHALLFADDARLRVREPLPGEKSRMEISSVGLGLRVAGWNGWKIDVDWARAYKSAGTVDVGDTHAHARVVYEF